ncbi:MAG: hypothetical protein V3G42_10905 [Oscillospiraceae bacterium]
MSNDIVLNQKYFNACTEKGEELKKYRTELKKRAIERFSVDRVTISSAHLTPSENADYFLSVQIHAKNSQEYATFAEAYLDPDGWRVALFDYHGRNAIRSKLEKAGILTVPSTNTFHRENRIPLTGLISFEDYDIVLNELDRAVFLISKYFPEVNS